MSNNVFIKSGYVKNLLPDSTSGTPTGSWMYKDAPLSAIQVVSTAAATVVLEGSNDGVNAVVTAIGTITLAAAGSDGLVNNAPWKFIRARVTANADTINVTMSN